MLDDSAKPTRLLSPADMVTLIFLGRWVGPLAVNRRRLHTCRVLSGRKPKRPGKLRTGAQGSDEKALSSAVPRFTLGGMSVRRVPRTTGAPLLGRVASAT